MSIKAFSLGAAQEVTGSKHVFEVNGRFYMVDCGAFQGKRKESDEKNRNFDFDGDKLEAVLLTHGHLDHCGLLPVLAKKGYKGNIYATPATRDIANLVMMDSARIQAHDYEFLAKQAAKKGKSLPGVLCMMKMIVLQLQIRLYHFHIIEKCIFLQMCSWNFLMQVIF